MHVQIKSNKQPHVTSCRPGRALARRRRQCSRVPRVRINQDQTWDVEFLCDEHEEHGWTFIRNPHVREGFDQWPAGVSDGLARRLLHPIIHLSNSPISSPTIRPTPCSSTSNFWAQWSTNTARIVGRGTAQELPKPKCCDWTWSKTSTSCISNTQLQLAYNRLIDINQQALSKYKQVIE